jgi:hypothetical protein
MSDQVRPEALPDNLDPVSKFTFNASLAADAKAANDAMIDAMQNRIDKIIDLFTVSDIPVIRGILGVSHDKDELKGLAKGLDRVADLIGVLDELELRKKILEYAEADPTWFASAFADLESEVERVITLDTEDQDLT